MLPFSGTLSVFVLNFGKIDVGACLCIEDTESGGVALVL